MKCTSVFLLSQEKEESRQKSIPSTPGKQERERPQRHQSWRDPRAEHEFGRLIHNVLARTPGVACIAGMVGTDTRTSIWWRLRQPCIIQPLISSSQVWIMQRMGGKSKKNKEASKQINKAPSPDAATLSHPFHLI